MFSVNAIGLDRRHTADFFIDRPDGSGDHLMLIFKTTALLDLDGRQINVPPDSALIYKKGTRQHYSAVGESYVNHFLHFSAQCPLPDMVRTDELLTPRSVRDSEELLRMISRELLSESPYRDEYISDMIKMMLMKLSEPCDKTSDAALNPHGALLDGLRADIYSNPGQFLTVAQLAESVSLSPSYFQQLYKTRFGVSCYEDLLCARIRTAQYYLATTALTIREIGVLCGYENEICFMHRFKERTGMPPGAYRKSVNGGHADG